MLSKDLVWDIIIDNMPRLMFMCRNDADCFGFAVLDRVESVARNYNGSSQPRTYLFTTVKWYAYKWFVTLPAARIKRGNFEHQLNEDICYTCSDAKLEVEDILALLEAEERELLVEHYLYGSSLSEMAHARGIGTMTLVKRINEALRKARERV